MAILGQAWYQASIPLPFGGFKPRSRETLELTFGKMDIFGFFDQNDTGGRIPPVPQFRLRAQPPLDAGGLGSHEATKPGWKPLPNTPSESRQVSGLRVSLRYTGEGVNYQRFFSSPLIMAQAETSLKFFSGLTGNYRVYAWSQGQGSELDGSTARQVGWGASADQRVGDA